jgi:hypothetical protein
VELVCGSLVVWFMCILFGLLGIMVMNDVYTFCYTFTYIFWILVNPLWEPQTNKQPALLQPADACSVRVYESYNLLLVRATPETRGWDRLPLHFCFNVLC